MRCLTAVGRRGSALAQEGRAQGECNGQNHDTYANQHGQNDPASASLGFGRGLGDAEGVDEEANDGGQWAHSNSIVAGGGTMRVCIREVRIAIQ